MAKQPVKAPTAAQTQTEEGAGQHTDQSTTTQTGESSQPTDDVKIVQFIRHYSRYTHGDIAGFPTEEANELIARKIAVIPGTEPEVKDDENAANNYC